MGEYRRSRGGGRSAEPSGTANGGDAGSALSRGPSVGFAATSPSLRDREDLEAP